MLEYMPGRQNSTLQTLQNSIGSLSTATLKELEKQLPWYRELRPRDRTALGLIAQKGIASFVSWYQKPAAKTWVLADVFGTAPTDLARSISLQKALQLIRVVVGTVEDHVPELAAGGDEDKLRLAVLRFSREVAFAAADVYARAAEARGAWDTRLEALVVDAILRGENSDSLRSRIAALGWKSKSPVTVVVGSAPEDANPSFVSDLRRSALRFSEDSLVGIQEDRIVLFLAGYRDSPESGQRVVNSLGPGPVVVSAPAPSLVEAGAQANAAFSAVTAAAALPAAALPISTGDLLPERAMNGDASASAQLVETIYTPLVKAGNGLLETLGAYVEMGHSLETSARELFVHANTVRYRLRRVTEITGWDPLIPREAFVLHAALIAGRLSTNLVGNLQNGGTSMVMPPPGNPTKVWNA